MSRIEQLIAELCPDGVEWKELREVCLSINAGGDLPENYKKGQLLPTAEFPYPIFSNGCDNNALYGFTDKYKIDSDAVTISARGTIGYHTIREAKFTPIVRLISLIPNKELITTKFLNYILDMTPIGGTNGGIPQLTVPTVKKVLIPIPPLPIQQEIVRILDTFTDLDTELQAELEARKKQYEHYRNQLLNFEGKEVEWKTLGEIGKFYGGLSGKSKNDFQDGNARFVTYMNVFSNIKVKTDIDVFVKIGEDENQNRVEYGDVLFTGSSETPDECGMASVLTEKSAEPLYLNSFCFGFRLYNEDLLLPNFSKYLFRDVNIRKQICQTANGVTRFNISKKRFAKILIPIPPLLEQQRIVSILDNFEALVNEELPAEITARRKQYEYYREKLLAFEPLVS